MIPFLDPVLNLGYRKDEPDPRNYILEKAQAPQPFPESFKTDLTALGVYNQEKIPDCVENAVTLVKRYHEYKNNTLLDLSRRFLACLTVKADGFPISQGTSLLQALKTAKNGGIAESSYLADDHSLDEVTFADYNAVDAQAIQNALSHRINSYAFLSDLTFNGLKNAIHQNGLVILAVKIDENWWTNKQGALSWAAGDVLPLRPPKDTVNITGHCVVAYAYDKDFIYIWNSFGPTWGYQGHGWFGPEYQPYIYEAATVVDFTPEQIQKAQQTIVAIQDLQTIETQTTDTGVKSLLQQAIDILAKFFTSIFNTQ